MKLLFFCLFIIPGFHGLAQKIYGTVFDTNGNVLPYSSILVKGTSQGVTANNQGKFELAIKQGNLVLVCQHIGYTRQEKKVILGKDDVEITFILAPQKLELKEVVVQSGDEDPAYAIIRQAIKKRPFYANQVKSFECEAYIKGLVKLRKLPKKILGKKIPDEDRKEMELDSAGKGIIYLSESVTHVAAQPPGKIKMEVISGRESGGGGFGFNFPTFISLYENNVNLFTAGINPRGFISPIADGAIGFYKYKYLGSFFEDGKEINSIQVTPRRKYEPLFSGVINITENDWRIHSCDLMLTKESQLEILDSLQISQIYVPVSKDIWRVKNQLLHFNLNMLGIDAIGNFVNVYSKYTINPNFSKHYFDRVIIKYDTSVNKKTKAYWDSTRPVPLDPEEIKDYKIKDSLYQKKLDSANTKSNIDSLKRKQGKLKPFNVLSKGLYRVHYNTTKETYTWYVDPVIKKLQYNLVQGVVVNLDAGFRKVLSKSTLMTINPHLQYGFSDHQVNAWGELNFRERDFDMDKKLKRESWHFAGGKRLSPFNKETTITPLSNTLGTLFYGDNYLKLYKNYFGEAGFSKRYESGWRFSIDALYENRIPVENITNFVVFKKDTVNITPNYPNERIPAQFSLHQALIGSITISVKPHQRYIEFPNSKVAIGSKYPTFTLNYSKGINNVLGSDVDFDKWKFSIYDDVNFKLYGKLRYRVAIGGFINANKVYIQDYQHFNGNQGLLAGEYVNTFQLAPFYTYSTTASFYALAHLEHHFNGFITNKLPLIKKLNWNLVAGTNAFYVNQNDNYGELFAGLENIFKLFRVDVVAGYQNGEKGLIKVRLGFGGIIGDAIESGRRGRPGNF